jgi:hypothetical protein
LEIKIVRFQKAITKESNDLVALFKNLFAASQMRFRRVHDRKR